MKFSPKERGFTLPEVLITMVVLSIGLLAMASVTAGIMKSTAFSKSLTTATALAQEKMEEIRGGGYASIQTSPGKATEEYESMALHPSFKRVVAFSDAGTPEDNMKLVTVSVYWNGDAHHAQVKTILGE